MRSSRLIGLSTGPKKDNKTRSDKKGGKKQKKKEDEKKQTINSSWETTEKFQYIDKIVMPHRKNSKELIVSHFCDELIPPWLLSRELDMHTDYYEKETHRFAWLPIRFSPENTGMKIFYTVVNRVDYLEQLIKKFPNVPQEVTFALLEEQDNYQLIIEYMESTGRYTDAELNRVWGKDDISPLELYDPRLCPAFTIEELPDMVMYMPYLKFWGTKIHIPCQNKLVYKLVELFSKLLPYPSKRRSVAKDIIQCWSDIMKEINIYKGDAKIQENRSEYNDIFLIIVRILLATMLGCYPHTTIHSSFLTRRKIYRWFCMNLPNKNDVGRWVLKYPYVVLYSIREFIFFSIEQVGGLYDFLADTTYWNFMKRIVYESGDMMRDKLNKTISKYMNDYSMQDGQCERVLSDMNSFCFPENEVMDDEILWLPGMPLFYNIQENLELANKRSLTRANRPKDCRFAEMVLIKMNKVECEKKERGKVNPRAIATEGTVEKEVLEYLELMINSIHPFEEFSYTKLGDHPFNMDSKILQYIQGGKMLYEFETTVSALKKTIAYAYSEYPRDYQLLKRYCQLILKKRSIRCYTLPDVIFKRQCKTLMRVYQTQPGQELSKCAGLYYVCLNCGKLKATVQDYSPNNDPESLGGFTSVGICIDMSDQGFYCTKVSSRENPKRRNPVHNPVKNMYFGDNDDEDVIDTELQDTLMIENIEDEEEDEDEDAVDVFDTNAGEEEGQSESEDEEATAKSMTSIAKGKKREAISLDRFLKKKAMQEKCLQTKLIPLNLTGREINTGNKRILLCPECGKPCRSSYKMYRSMTGGISCGCSHDKMEFRVLCCLCNVDCSHDMVLHLILNDRDYDVPRVENMTFCQKHKNQWIPLAKRMPKLSEVVTKQSSGMSVHFLEKDFFLEKRSPVSTKNKKNTATR